MTAKTTTPRRKPIKLALAEHAPWMPPAWDLADATALKALQAGTADADQQKRALKWMIEKAAATFDMHFFAGEDGERNTNFSLGRAFVGQQTVKLLNIDLTKVRRDT